MIPVLIKTALATPLQRPIAERQSRKLSNCAPAYPMTLLQELQAILEARSGSGLLPKTFEAPVPAPNSLQPEKSSCPARGPASEPGAQEPGPSSTEPSSGQAEPGTGSIRSREA